MSNEAEKDWVEATLEGLPPLVKAKEAAVVLRTTPRTLYRWIALGRILTVKRPGGDASAVLIPKASLAKYLRSLEQGAA